MLTTALPNLHAWALYLERAPLPVLQRTVNELAALHERLDQITGRDLSRIILHDPMMTLRVLRYLQSHRAPSQQTEVTTIAHAIMMMGLGPFFRAFQDLPTLENHLRDHPDAMHGVMRVMSRARHAALFAEDWSRLRHDLESDEVTIAALLHDAGEMLLWCFAPTLATQIRQLQQDNPGMRSAEAQKQVLGFPLPVLQQELGRQWHLPALLQVLMDDQQDQRSPRVHNVVLAVSLARHAANGLHDAALPDDYKAVQQFLALNPEQTWDHIRRMILKAGREWDWYGVPPVAAWLPQQ